jgi:hypothetical protein
MKSIRSESKPVELSSAESRIVLQLISLGIEREHRALELCRRERPSLDVQESIRERELQITKFERLREKIGEQL